LDKRKILRIIDANLNRAREGLRVCEDITRFLLDDQGGARKFKNIRHNIFSAIDRSGISSPELLKERNVKCDVGKSSTQEELFRRDWSSVFLANIQRVKESTRVLEEIFKLLDKKQAKRFKEIRFAVYQVEKKVIIKHKISLNHK
jgi:ThiD2 family